MKYIVNNFLMGISTVILILILPIYGYNIRNDVPKAWECHRNNTNFEDCLIDVFPVVMSRWSYVNKFYKGGKTELAIKDFTIKPDKFQSKCTHVKVTGMESGCTVSNFYANMRNNVFEFNSYNPELRMTASCVYEKYDSTLNEANAIDIEMIMYEPPIKHSISYGVDPVTQKIYIGDWNIFFESNRVFIDDTDSLGVKRYCNFCAKLFTPDRYSKLAFERIKVELENGIGRELKKIANQVKDSTNL
ncbi:hypothetical protein HCN44_003242 [Aphidius gifuensis]|uniref:Uncharacterized protein n=1 Tax=Aphidius gifuensis TaxID=684658 RepID=A0A834XIQ3_APHGI|nr:uncharacterized protein LOC122859713 [Aphidius gifuensis]KAF7987480.1 hypothetical protein HCN44_003242 [Aphidius gifuensis]